METEAKFTVPGEAAFARLRGIERFGDYERRDEKTKQVHDRYLDTPSLNFLNSGWSLRLRKGKEGDLLITIKGLERQALDDGADAGSIAARQEYETSVKDLDIQRWPESEARRMAEMLAVNQPVHDLVSVDQIRTVSRLYDGDRAVAELSLDEVTFHKGDKDSDSTAAYELEAELLPDGTVADIRALAHIFTEEYGLDPQSQSKFEQALQLADLGSRVADLAGQPPATAKRKRTRRNDKQAEQATPTAVEASAPEPTPEAAKVEGEPDDKIENQNADKLPDKVEIRNPQSQIRHTDSMGLAGRKLIAHNFEAMLSNEEGSRLGEDVEAVHDMRVATRRMRAAMRVFGPYFKGKRAADVRAGLREVANVLGEVRDLDVLIDKADAFRTTLSAERQAGLSSMIEEWRVNRWKARKSLLRLLDSREYRSFKRDMDRFLDEKIDPPDETEGAQPYQVRHVMGSTIMQHYEVVRAYEALPDEPTIPQLHALRIAGKYFRYTLEFFRDVLPKDALAMIRDITKLQDDLGELHDADVALTLVNDYIGQQGRRRKQAAAEDDQQEVSIAPGLAAYQDKLRDVMDHKSKEYVTTWANLNSQEWRKRLAALLVREG